MQHHPVFSQFKWTALKSDGKTSTNWIGASWRAAWDAAVVPNARQFQTGTRSSGDAEAESRMPGFDEEYFEWIDLLESVTDYVQRDLGTRPFAFAELGAGYGRWAVNAVRALEQAAGARCEYLLCAIEADRQHFEWLQQNLADNGIDAGSQVLVNRPLTGDGRRVSFLAGGYGREFGQAVVDAGAALRLRATGRVPGFGKSLLDRILPRRRRFKPLEGMFLEELESETLSQVLTRIGRVVDLADLDLQGMEAEVVEESLPLLCDQVKRLHIGTHSHEVEQRLRKCLGTAGWQSLRDYPCFGASDTPYGRIAFGDGVQSWVNRNLRLQARAERFAR